MYILAILTKSDEVREVLKFFDFNDMCFSDDDDAWKYEMIFYNKLNLTEKESYFKSLLDDYDDTIVWSYEQDNFTDEFINEYDEYGVKPSYFY